LTAKQTASELAGDLSSVIVEMTVKTLEFTYTLCCTYAY